MFDPTTFEYFPSNDDREHTSRALELFHATQPVMNVVLADDGKILRERGMDNLIEGFRHLWEASEASMETLRYLVCYISELEDAIRAESKSEAVDA